MKSLGMTGVSALVVVAFAICCACQPARAEEKADPPLYVAVLDLQSPPGAPWLGAAVAESLSAKLTGVQGIRMVEREKITFALIAAGVDANGLKRAAGVAAATQAAIPVLPEGKFSDAEVKVDAAVTPALLGANVLVMGSVQLIGKWPQETGAVRISVKAVAAQTGMLKDSAAIVVDGTVKTLFDMESQVAEKMAKAMGKEATVYDLEFREEKNLVAKQLFGEGLALLNEAERLMAQIEEEKKKAAKPQGEGQK